MAESSISITSSGSTNLRTDTKTISAATRHQEYMLQGEHSLAAYTAQAQAAVTATLDSHLLQIMAGSSLNVRIRVIKIWQAALAGSVATGAFELLRLTTAGTGGTSVTPRPLDSADSASGATAMTLPSSKGTEGVSIARARMGLVAAHPVNPNGMPLILYEARSDSKPLIIPAGTPNGICVKNVLAVASASVDIYIELVETTFV